MANSYSENAQFHAAVRASQQLLDQVASPPNLQNQTSAGPPAYLTRLRHRRPCGPHRSRTTNAFWRPVWPTVSARRRR
jgi:hypothetical protein